MKKYKFPNRSLEIWNGLKEEMVRARNILFCNLLPSPACLGLGPIRIPPMYSLRVIRGILEGIRGDVGQQLHFPKSQIAKRKARNIPISKESWMKADMETGQHELSSISVHYH